MPLGYWEAKDDKDDLDDEIEKKLKQGYPQDNIIFSDDVTAVLVQNKNETLRCAMTDTVALSKLLMLSFSFERPEIAGFRRAVEQFKTDLPAVSLALRQMIEAAHDANAGFQQAEEKFLVHAQEAINPTLNAADVRERAGVEPDGVDSCMRHHPLPMYASWAERRMCERDSVFQRPISWGHRGCLSGVT